MRHYIDRRVTPPKRVTSPTWGPPPQCKQALTWGPPPPCKQALSYELELGHVYANRDIFEPAYIFVTQIPLNGALSEKTRKSKLFCRFHYKGSTFFSVIQRPWVLVRPGFEPVKSRSADPRSPNWANQAAVQSCTASVQRWIAQQSGVCMALYSWLQSFIAQ